MRTILAFCLVVVSGCDGGAKPQCLSPTNQRPEPAYELRDPTTGVCQTFGGGGDCIDPCGICPPSGLADPDWAMCYSACENLDEASCKSAPACRAIYNGATSTFYQCWGTAPSGPIQGGMCTGLDVQECSRHDDCIATHEGGSPIGSFMSCGPEGTTSDPGSCVGTVTCPTPEPQCPMDTIAGRRNGCWTGFCIPYAQCDMLPACDTLAEVECVRRSDCAPTYTGQNCTCNGSTCTCESWVFDSCK